VKVRRQNSAVSHLCRRSNEVIRTLVIQPRQRTNHIADVSPDAEFRHATDVDGYFHEWNLITEDSGSTGNSPQFCHAEQNERRHPPLNCPSSAKPRTSLSPNLSFRAKARDPQFAVRWTYHLAPDAKRRLCPNFRLRPGSPLGIERKLLGQSNHLLTDFREHRGIRPMIERLAGATHDVSTRFALGEASPTAPVAFARTVTTRVTFRAVSTQEAAGLPSAFLNHESCDNSTPGGRLDSP